jgi:hypothetical protein
MPYKPDQPCAVCGKLMWRGTGSLPPGLATCLPCRRARQKPKPAARQHICQKCGIPFVTEYGDKRWKYCGPECFRKAQHARGSGTPSAKSTGARGYGRPHRRLRARLLPSAYGTPCVLCGEVMSEGEPLHLDHTEDRLGYRGFAHASCNILDGARRGGQRERARRLATGRRTPRKRRRAQPKG